MLFFFLKGISQNNKANTNIMGNINASGNNATGSSGTVTYSIGQVFYTYIGESVYNVAQGIQHEEIQASHPIEDIIEPTTEIFIYPNPTSDIVNIKMKASEFEKGPKFYQLYDYQGRLLKQNTITETESKINLSNLSPSVYILRVYANNTVLKTFKILKK